MMTSASRAVVLIGLRGAGKTTLGRRLAESLGRSFQDLDERALAGCPESTVQAVFDTRGEAAWREAEATAFGEALSEGIDILALGGGAPMVEAIDAALETGRANGRVRVIWLDAEDSVLAERIGAHDHHRPPLLAGAPDAAAETRAVRARRGPTFARLADVTLDTGGDPENLLQELVDAATG
jgi:shikimate kinase